VRTASQRMATLIDDLLKLARVTRVEMRTERVDLSAMAQDIVADLQRNDTAGKSNSRLPRGSRRAQTPRCCGLCSRISCGTAGNTPPSSRGRASNSDRTDANGGRAFMSGTTAPAST